MIPVGENIATESDIRYKAVNAGYVLGKMEASESRTNVIVLDACRNNPLKGFRSLRNGLTMMDRPRAEPLSDEIRSYFRTGLPPFYISLRQSRFYVYHSMIKLFPPFPRKRESVFVFDWQKNRTVS